MNSDSTTAFDELKLWLGKPGEGRTNCKFRPKGIIFAQGDPAESVHFIQHGQIKLTVLSETGKEAVLALLGSGAFFGQNCLVGETQRSFTASALTECTVTRLERTAALALIKNQPTFSECMMTYLLKRNIQMQESLVDQLFNSSEKRLARVLLMLANFGTEHRPETVISRISQETLAEMIGTTRSRVNAFMNEFRRLGFIDYNYNGEIRVRSSLLQVLLRD
jgi:CRP/FNR family cyclic AMP-dependent transcriptional regulator